PEALDRRGVFDDAEAALLVDHASFPFREDGIDQGDEFSSLHLADVDNDDLEQDADLVGRQADARGVVHGFGHVGGELFQLVVKTGYLGGLLPQNRIRKSEYCSDGHDRDREYLVKKNSDYRQSSANVLLVLEKK